MAFHRDEILAGQILAIDKPLHWTSFDVVNKIRYALRKAYGFKKLKVGHAGTLDPLATGLLLIAVGAATKKIEGYMGQSKRYTGSMRLGQSTPSYDAETEVDAHYPTAHLNEALLQATLPQFRGALLQKPPIFSAIKKGGVKSYEAARLGEKPDLPPRPVGIFSFELTALRLPEEVDFAVHCSKGTYIRSLAHDYGQALGSGAYLSALRRTAIGDFSLDQAQSLDDFLAALPSPERA